MRSATAGTYLVLAFAIAWIGVGFIASRTGLPARAEALETTRYLVFIAMLAGPTSASFGLAAWSGGTRALRDLVSGLGRWRVAGRWYATLLIAPCILALTLGAFSVASPAYLPGIATSPARWLIAFAAVSGGVAAGLFEELGWTGFATPRLLARYSWPRAGVLLGIVWAAWHVLPDYWGGAAYGKLWSLHMLQWIVALAAFRTLMTWVYAHTRSLLLGVLLHASFTGSQLLLWPAATLPAHELAWYGVFAAALWLVVGGAVLAQQAMHRSVSVTDI